MATLPQLPQLIPRAPGNVVEAASAMLTVNHTDAAADLMHHGSTPLLLTTVNHAGLTTQEHMSLTPSVLQGAAHQGINVNNNADMAQLLMAADTVEGEADIQDPVKTAMKSAKQTGKKRKANDAGIGKNAKTVLRTATFGTINKLLNELCAIIRRIT